MKRLGAGFAMIVVALGLVTPGAVAQNGSAWLTPRSPQKLESFVEVVLTVSMWRPGRVAYQTFDGACSVGFSPGGSPPDVACSDGGKARAPGDYTATSGQLVFTEGGRKTITIPIVDDELSEGDEAFTVAAWEETNADPWIDRGDSVTVHIADDEVDPTDDGAAAAPEPGFTNGGPAAAQSFGSRAAAAASGPTLPNASGAPADPAATTTTTSRALEVALPDSDFRPGPGFELTSEEASESAFERRGGTTGSASGLAIGSGAAALGVGALAAVHRRRRWSSTRV